MQAGRVHQYHRTLTVLVAAVAMDPLVGLTLLSVAQKAPLIIILTACMTERTLDLLQIAGERIISFLIRSNHNQSTNPAEITPQSSGRRRFHLCDDDEVLYAIS